MRVVGVGAAFVCVAFMAAAPASAVTVKPPWLEEKVGQPKELPAPNSPPTTAPTTPAPTPAPSLPQEHAENGHIELYRSRVPRLIGHTLTGAIRALAPSGCHLGRVIRPGHAHGKLVVVKQSIPAGEAFISGGITVSVTLGHGTRRT